MSASVEPLPVTRLGAEQIAGPEAGCCRRNSTPVISLDFSDAMCAVEMCGDESMESGMSPWTASGTTRALLVVFELACPSEEDCAVSGADLEKVLRRQLCGDSDDNAHTISDILNGASSRNLAGDGRVDFFSYWQSMDMFFNERGLFFQAECESHLDVVEGARCLRDHVLATYDGTISQESPTPELLTVVLEGCIEDECRRQDLVSAFLGHGMTLPQFGGMIYACLKKHCEVSQETDVTLWDHEDREMLQGSLSPSTRRASSSSIQSLASPVASQRRRISLASVVDESQPMDELAEIVERSIGRKDKEAQSAIALILRRHESMSSKVRQQEDSICSLQADISALDREREELKAELLQARELCEDAEDWKRECEKQRQRAAAFEKQVAEVEEQSSSASQSLKRLQLEHREASREHADCQRRYTQLREYCDRLEFSSNTSEEKMRELELAAQRAERRSVQLSNELEKHSFNSNLAKVLQRRSMQLASVEEKPANGTDLGRMHANPPVPEVPSRGSFASSTSSNGNGNGHGEPQSNASEVAMLKQQLAVQQTQLQSLRTARNEFLAAQSAEPNHSKLLAAQLRSMLQHTQRLENLLDRQSSSVAAPSADHLHEEGYEIAFSTNLAEQLAAQIESGDVEELCSPGDGKSPARESTVSTTFSSGTAPFNRSHGSISASSASMLEEGEHGDSFLLGGSGLQVETSPKKKLADNAKVVMRAQRFKNVLTIPETQERRKRTSKSNGNPSSRSRHSVAKSDGRTKAEQQEQEQDSWMPSLSGLYTAITGPTSEADQSTDEEDEKERRHRHKSRSSAHSTHKHRRSEMVARR